MTEQPSYKTPLIFAVILHLILFIALFLHFAPQMHLTGNSPVKIVNATLVDQKGLASKVVREPKESKKPQPIAEVTPPPQPQQLKPLPDLKQEQVIAAQQQAQQAAQKVAEQQAIQAAATKAAQVAKLKQQQILVAKRKAQQQKQKQLKQQLQLAQQKLLQQQMQQDQQQLSTAAAAAAQNQADQSEIDKYKAMIVQMISQNWLVPDNSNKDLSCQLLIQVGPGGAVLNVQVAQSSGNPQLDDSAVAAVMKTSPLPVPDDPKLFDKFRELRLTVKPESVTTN